jgi:hypothetical protein
MQFLWRMQIKTIGVALFGKNAHIDHAISLSFDHF